MNNKTTVIVAAVVFALVGTLVFAAIAPYLSSEVDATRAMLSCPHEDKNPDSRGCGNGPPTRVIGPPGPR